MVRLREEKQQQLVEALKGTHFITTMILTTLSLCRLNLKMLSIAAAVFDDAFFFDFSMNEFFCVFL